jgi:two-component system sensor histidine kinase/response regulator
LRALAGQLEQTNEALHERASALSDALETADRSFSELASYIQAIDQHALVTIVDESGRLIQVNDRFVASHGYSREQLLGQHYRMLSASAEDNHFDIDVWNTVARDRIWRGEICNRTREGALIWTDCAIVPLQNAHQKDARFISLSIDITERKEAEAKLLNAMRIAESANAAKSEFLANMSHEIRTPMNGIIGMNELAMATEDREEQREYLRLVKSSADSLLVIVNDILDFSKIEAGQMTLEHISFNLHDVLRDIIKSVAVRIGSKNVELLHEIHPDVPARLVGDPERLRQIILNLLGNAVRFTHHGEIVLSVMAESASDGATILRFSVRDTGIGIPKEKQQSIFQAFSQGDSSITRRYGGTGLGLSICSRLVDLMGGRIWLESAPGMGSTFHFTARFGSMPDASAVDAHISLDDTPVLIVDDNASSRRILADILRRWNMQPTGVDSGEQALAALAGARVQGNGYALMLMDEQMPGMDGVTTVQQIRSRFGQTDTPVIMMTSSGTPDNAYSRVAEHLTCLSKPVTPSALLEAIQAAFSKGSVPAQEEQAATGQPVAIGNLSILLAEDNEINQRLAITLLERAGHRVTVAPDGRQALQALQRDDYDLILMDMQMPEMGGIEATRHIREQERLHGGHIPIVAMTANAMDEDRERCLAAGMDNYLSKPITSARLFACIEAVLQQHGGDRSRQKRPLQADERPAAAPAMRGFDYAAAIAQADREMLNIIGAMTIEAIPQHLADIGRALDQNAQDELRRSAHTLKGALGYFRATPVVDWARKMELHAERGEIAEARDCFQPLQDELEKFRPVAVALLRSGSTEPV